MSLLHLSPSYAQDNNQADNTQPAESTQSNDKSPDTESKPDSEQKQKKAAPPTTKLVITGIEDELEENVRLLAGKPPSDARLLDLYIEVLPIQAAKAMAALGYYNPEISVDSTNGKDGKQITLNVDPQEPVLVNKVLISILGDAQTDPEFMSVFGKIPLRKNAIFNSSDYESTKGIMIDAAQTYGYFDFEFTTNTVRVSRNASTADVELVGQSGPRYTFGQVKFDQNIFTEEFLNRWLPFAPNDPYEASKIADLTKNLQRSGYFSSVRVAPQRDKRYGPTVPVQITLVRKDKNLMGVGVGYDSDVGPRAKLTWAKPLINRAGHSANAELGVSQHTQNISFAYRIPRKNQPLNNYWGLEYGLQNSDKDPKNFLSTLNFQRVRKFANDWQESVFIRWERELFTIADEDLRSDLILPGVSYTRTRSRGAPFLDWGQSTFFQIMYGNRIFLSDIDFLKATIKFKYLRALSKHHAVIASIQYGGITTNNFDLAPISHRFFAGGDRSVRGYKYRSISPTEDKVNDDGDIVNVATGGRFLEVASFEYNYRFADNWSVAAFTDVGRAFNDWSTKPKTGAGVGIRWQSPVGPLKIDVAIPINDPDNDQPRIHFSLGPEL